MKRTKANGGDLLARLEAEVRRMEHGRIANTFLGGDEGLARLLLADLIAPAGEPVPVYTDDGRIWEYEDADGAALPNADEAHGILVPLLRRAFVALYRAGQAAAVTGEPMTDAARHAEAMRRAEAKDGTRPARVSAGEFKAMCACGDALAACIGCAAKPQRHCYAVTQDELCEYVKRAGGSISSDTIERALNGTRVRKIPLPLVAILPQALTSKAAAADWAQQLATSQRVKLKSKRRVSFNEAIAEHSGFTTATAAHNKRK